MMRKLLILVFLSAMATSGHAAMIATDAAQPASERERVKALLARPEVVREMQKLGLSASEASARVDTMTDDEVARLAGRIDALPAGGRTLTNQEVGLIILIVILVLLII